MEDSTASSLRALLPTEAQRRTAHEFVCDALRRAILSGHLKGGTRLVQADIAAQLNVSTTPVREALRELAADGLIRFDAHRGGIVSTVDTAEVLEIYEIRKLLEPHAMRRAAGHVTEATLTSVEELAARMEAEDDAGVWTELNWRFHRQLVAASGSPRLEAIVASLQDSAALYVAHSLHHRPERTQAGNQEHRDLLAALRAGDGETAAAVTLTHLEGTLAEFEDTGGAEAPPPASSLPSSVAVTPPPW